MIIEARVDEIIDLCQDAIDKSGIRLGNWSNIYLTGGGLMLMKGARVYVASKMKYNVREGTAKMLKMKQPQIYASGSGLVELVYNTLEQQEQDTGFLDKLRRMFRK